MSNVISFRANRYSKMEAIDVFNEILCKENMDAEDEMFLGIAIQQLGFTPEDLESLANTAMLRAEELLNS